MSSIGEEKNKNLEKSRDRGLDFLRRDLSISPELGVEKEVKEETTKDPLSFIREDIGDVSIKKEPKDDRNFFQKLFGRKKDKIVTETIDLGKDDKDSVSITPPEETEINPENFIKVNIPEKSNLAFKNNNPGNLEYREQEGATLAEDGRFAKFESPEKGLIALAKQILLDSQRDFTLSEFINKYAPPEENKTNEYLSNITASLGVSENTKLKDIDPIQLTEKIAHQESNADVEFIEPEVEEKDIFGFDKEPQTAKTSTMAFVGSNRKAENLDEGAFGVGTKTAITNHILQWGKFLMTGLRASTELVGAAKKRREEVLKRSPELGEEGTIGAVIDKFQNFIEQPNDKVEKFSEKVIKSFNNQQADALQTLLSDPNASQEKIKFLITNGFLSITEAMAITALTKNTNLAATLLTSLEATDVYNDARAKGFSPTGALAVTAESGIPTYLLEKVGLDIFIGLSGGNSIIRALLAGTSETIQENTQEVWQALVRKKEFDESLDLMQTFVDTSIATFIPSTAVSFFLPGGNFQNKSEITKQIMRASGVDEKTAKGFLKEIEKSVQESRVELEKTFDLTEETRQKLDKPLDQQETVEEEPIDTTIIEEETLETEEEPVKGVREDVIKHGTRNSAKQIIEEGFKMSKRGALGEAAYFTDSERMLEQFADNDIIEVKPSDFDLIRVETLEEKDNLIEITGTENLADAVRALNYDGFIYTNKNAEVGNTFAIVNQDKLNQVIRGEMKKPKVDQRTISENEITNKEATELGFETVEDQEQTFNIQRIENEPVAITYLNEDNDVVLQEIHPDERNSDSVKEILVNLSNQSDTGDVNLVVTNNDMANMLEQFGDLTYDPRSKKGSFVPNESVIEEVNKKVAERARQSMKEDYKRETPEERAKNEVIDELRLSEPGRRDYISEPGPFGQITKTVGIPSTFPRWIPEESVNFKTSLRSSKLVKEVADHIENGTEPNKGTKAAELYDIAQEVIKQKIKEGYIGSPIDIMSLDSSLEFSMPDVARVNNNGYNWNSLNKSDKAAVNMWVKMGKEGLPPNVTEKLSNVDNPILSENETIRIDSSEYIMSEKEVEGFSAHNKLESKLALKVDARKAVEKLSNIATKLGVNGIKAKQLSQKGSLYNGVLEYKADELISVSIKDLQNFIVLGHEVGHLFDVSIIGKEKTGKFQTFKTLQERVGDEVPEKVMWNELKDLTQYVRPFKIKDSTGFTAYRHRRSELFADWFTTYLNDYQMAKILAPKFTEQMEKAYKDDLAWLRNEYQFSSNLVSSREMSDKYADKVKTGIMNMFEKVKPDQEVEVVTKLDSSLQKAKLSFWRLLNIPKWIGEKHPEFGDMWESVTNNTVHKYSARKAEILTESKIEDYRKDLTNEQKRIIAKALYEGNDKGVETEWTDNQLIDMYGLEEKGIKAYRDIRKGHKMILENYIEGFKQKYGYYQMNNEEKKVFDQWIKNEVSRIAGWVSLKRQGDYFVYGEHIDNADKREVIFEAFDKKEDAIKFSNHLNKIKYENVKVYPKGMELDSERFKRLSGADWVTVETYAEQAGIKDSEDIKKLIEQLKVIGTRRPLMTRKWIPGYTRDFDHLYRAMLSEIEQSSRVRYKEASIRYMDSRLSNMDRNKNPVLYAYAQQYKDGLFKSSGEGWTGVRKGIYIWYLALKTSFLIQNLTQPFLTTLPEIANHVGPIKSAKIFGKAYPMMASYYLSRISKKAKNNMPTKIREGLEKLAGDEKPDSEFKKLMDKAINEELVTGAFNEQILGTINKTKSKFENAIGVLGIVGEMANRGHAVAVAYQISQERGVTDIEEQFQLAKKISDRTQFSYGSHNVPVAIQSLPKWLKGPAKTLFVFKSFMLNYMHFLSQRVISGSTGAKVYGISSLATIGGITAFPFYQLINAIIRSLTGSDVDEELYKAFNEEDEWIADVILKGAPTFASMDVSTMIGVGDMLNPNFDIGGQIYGAGYGLVDDFSYGFKLAREGRYEEAAEKFTPYAIRNILAANRHAKEGYKFYESGTYIPSKFETIQKGLGFTPHAVSKEYDISNIIKGKRSTYDRLRERYQSSYKRNGYVDPEGKIVEDIIKHNQDVTDSLYYVFEGSEVGITKKKFNSLYKSLTASEDDLLRWQKDVDEQKANVRE